MQRLAAAIVVAALIVAPQAWAGEVRILTAGAMRATVLELAPAFGKEKGHKLIIDNDTAGGLLKRISGGEPFDVAIITPKAIDELIAGGRMATGSRVDLARVGVGVAVREGAAVPDIGTVEALKKTLLAAKSVAYRDPKSGGTSGIYFDSLLDRLGIGGEVRAKAVLRATGYVAELVAAGEAEIVVQQMSEIVPVKGVKIVGPLPVEVQNYTVYAAGVAPAPRDAAAAKAVVDVLTGPAATAVLQSKGMERP